MWVDLFAAIGLLLVIEGILPFVSPAKVRETLQRIGELDDHMLRALGLASMAAGLLILYFVR